MFNSLVKNYGIPTLIPFIFMLYILKSLGLDKQQYEI